MDTFPPSSGRRTSLLPTPTKSTPTSCPRSKWPKLALGRLVHFCYRSVTLVMKDFSHGKGLPRFVNVHEPSSGAERLVLSRYPKKSALLDGTTSYPHQVVCFHFCSFSWRNGLPG